MSADTDAFFILHNEKGCRQILQVKIVFSQILSFALQTIWKMKCIFQSVFVLVCLQRGQRSTDPEEVTNEALRTMCDNTLHLLTTTVGRLADVNLCLSPSLSISFQSISGWSFLRFLTCIFYFWRYYGPSCSTIWPLHSSVMPPLLSVRVL